MHFLINQNSSPIALYTELGPFCALEIPVLLSLKQSKNKDGPQCPHLSHSLDSAEQKLHVTRHLGILRAFVFSSGSQSGRPAKPESYREKRGTSGSPESQDKAAIPVFDVLWTPSAGPDVSPCLSPIQPAALWPLRHTVPPRQPPLHQPPRLAKGWWAPNNDLMCEKLTTINKQHQKPCSM